MKNFIFNLLDWIYKRKCYFCGKSKESAKMCTACYEKMMHNSLVPNRNIDGIQIFACGLYENIMQKMIRGLKYHGQRDLAYFQAKFMWEYWEKLGIDGDFIIIPVPLYKSRKKKRGYNHMELVAIELSKLSGFEYDFNLIKRVKDTKPQYRLKKVERYENLKNAFIVDCNNKPEKSILLIDDICTTGSTFHSMILELNKNGIYNITCLATATVDF